MNQASSIDSSVKQEGAIVFVAGSWVPINSFDNFIQRKGCTCSCKNFYLWFAAASCRLQLVKVGISSVCAIANWIQCLCWSVKSNVSEGSALLAEVASSRATSWQFKIGWVSLSSTYKHIPWYYTHLMITTCPGLFGQVFSNAHGFTNHFTSWKGGTQLLHAPNSLNMKYPWIYSASWKWEIQLFTLWIQKDMLPLLCMLPEWRMSVELWTASLLGNGILNCLATSTSWIHLHTCAKCD